MVFDLKNKRLAMLTEVGNRQKKQRLILILATYLAAHSDENTKKPAHETARRIPVDAEPFFRFRLRRNPPKKP